MIYGADESDDWTDPKVWKKANPSLDITVGIDKVKAACESAKQNPGEENSFRQLRLNQWVKQSVRWMPMEKWNACAYPIEEKELEGRVCYGGLDLSSTTDLSAFVLVFPPEDDEDKYIILPYFWIPEENMERIVMHYLRARFEDESLVWIVENDAPITMMVDVCGYQFMLTHGQGVNIESMARDSVNLYNKPIDVFMVGHLHKGQTFQSGIMQNSNVYVERVPSICGIDPYAQSKGYDD